MELEKTIRNKLAEVLKIENPEEISGVDQIEIRLSGQLLYLPQTLYKNLQ